MIGWRVVMGLVVTPVVLGALAWPGAAPTPTQRGRLHTVTLRSVESSVTAVGELETSVATAISSPLRGNSGRILAIASNGSAVVQGQVILRFDPSGFEDAVAAAETALDEAGANAELQRRAVEWEKIQSERDVEGASFELGSAELDLERVIKGDGPLELGRLETARRDAESEWSMLQSYVEAVVELHEEGFISEAEVLQSRRQLEDLAQKLATAEQAYQTYRDHVLPSQIEKARSEVRRAESVLERTRRAAAIQVGRAEAELERKRDQVEQRAAELATARTQLSRTVVRAPTDGIVILREQFRDGQRRWPQVGDEAYEGQPLLDLPDLSTMTVRIRLREDELHLVEVDAPVVIRVSAFPDRTMQGRLASIGAMAERTSGQLGVTRTFDARIAIEDPPSMLRPGMTATVEISATPAAPMPTVPIPAVRVDEAGWYCLVDADGTVKRRSVRTGRVGRDLIEISEGLEPGEQVVVAEPEA
jgi:HlyD family secretion protein